MKSIAIVSVGLRLPSARTLDEFTEILADGRDLAQSRSDEPRWQKRGERLPKDEGFFHDRSYRVENWREDRAELSELDPLFHLAYGAAHDAFQACHTQGLAAQRIGLILGNIALPTETSSRLASEWLARVWNLGQTPKPSETSLRANLSPAAMPALVIGQLLGIEGSTFTLDAACASSLYAIKLACDELTEGRLDMVLAGGLSRPDPLYTQVGFTALDALSKSGKAYPLDERADGLMVGEGAGIFALKRLEDAERQGDTILAVIRGIGLSNDKEGGLMAPSQEGQLRAMQAAYVDAEWDPLSVELIECHATGTRLGDTTEIESLKRMRSGSSPAVLGSVKGNVGHMLTAAGSAGLAKILCAFREQKFWPTANFKTAPLAWDLASKGLRVLNRTEAWSSRHELRRAALSGFGFGGINAHLLVEEYKRDVSETVVRIKAKHRVAVVQASEWHDAPGRESLEVGFKQFRIPPKEMQDILPQQVYSLLAMDRLERLVGIDRDKSACFVGVELDAMTSLFATRWQLQDKLPDLDLNAYVPALEANQVMGSLASIVASRLARELQFGGPAFTVAALEASGLKALDLAFRAIARGELSSALVMATDIGTSHRAAAQLSERYGSIWKHGSDTATALYLMNEQKARDLNIPVAIVLDDFHDFSSLLDRPLSEGPLWIEDLNRNSSWLQNIVDPHKKLLEGHHYKGAAHGLSSVVEIWEKGYEHEKRSAFLMKDERLHQLSWMQTAALPVVRDAAVSRESYSILRRDQKLPPVEGLFKKSPEPQFRVDSSSPKPKAPESMASLGSPLVPPAGDAAPRAHVFVNQLLRQELDSIAAHEQYLRLQGEGDALMSHLLGRIQGLPMAETQAPMPTPVPSRSWVGAPFNPTPALYDYAACEEFAKGQIGKVFGPEFAAIDQFPTRVRLPAERLLLCHRVMSIEGDARSLGRGRMVTEHDVFADAWYLEEGDEFMPTSIVVESGQADLMLSAYLGADFVTRGLAVYRLLDARVSFHSKPPKIGETIRYEIEIKKFFEQGSTLFFNFAFEAYVGNRHVISMVDGCAGFFSAEALSDGRGIKRSQLQLKAYPGKIVGGFKPLVAMQKESYRAQELDALRRGDYPSAFGPAFPLPLKSAKKLPSGDMKLVHRILEIDPKGGRFGIGQIIGEADIQPDDWFLTCHFIDDQVMPGTLMFECCLHTLRVFLMRAGWVGEEGMQSLVPKAGVWSGLKCRGQVLSSTAKVTYEIEIKEMGYGPDAYVICDALMYADGKPIVDITDMSLTIPGQGKDFFESLWQSPQGTVPLAPAYDYEHILAFSDGNPSDCFGEVYRAFDRERKIARLPRPPFQFLDSIEWVDGPFMKQNVGTKLLAHYENPDDAWYWDLNQERLPFSVLVEIALQPCGFMAAYMGSALCSERDLKFRNLSGEATLLQDIRRGDGRLSIEVSSTKIAKSGDMIIQDYSFRVFNHRGDVYQGVTSFGFFTEEALAQQAGVRGQASWTERVIEEPYPSSPAVPAGKLRLVEAWKREGLKVFAAKKVNPDEWFFAAHFFEDPVMPGSLGLESLTQVAVAEADRLWPGHHWRVALGSRHNWIYRGQVRRHNKELRFALELTHVGEETLSFDSVLYCDGLAIYTLGSLSLEKA